MDLAALISPIGVDHFMREYFGRRPLHIPAGEGASKRLLDWPRVSTLLGVAPHWSEGNLNLILNRRPVLADFFMDSVATLAGPVRRADPAKVEVFLAMGASLIANYVEQIAPELRVVTDLLGEHFAALTNANVYGSFKGVQGFATHFDLHEVFAVQCEGEKVWQIYANRADNPLEALASGGEEAQQQINAARGPLAMTVRMRPGDVLYLPRGVYHDALAQDGASLHVTFSAAPHSGAVVLELLQAAALRDPAVRAYLPDGRRDPAALGAQLAKIAQRLAAIVASRGFRDEVIDAERARSQTAHPVMLPVPPALVSYARTDRPAEVRRLAAGAMLVTGRGEHALGLGFAAAEYALSRPAFSAQELGARYPHVPAGERDALIALLVREQLIERYIPRLM